MVALRKPGWPYVYVGETPAWNGAKRILLAVDLPPPGPADPWLVTNPAFYTKEVVEFERTGEIVEIGPTHRAWLYLAVGGKVLP